MAARTVPAGIRIARAPTRKELDMETLVWTRGRGFPLSRLETRLRCPRCGSREVVVLYQPPSRAVVG